MRRKVSAGTAAALLLVLSGCDFYYNTLPSPDDLMKAVPWFDHMITSPAVHPYETGAVPRNTVYGSVPVTKSEADWGPEWATGNFAIADGIANPTDPQTTMAVGDSLYHVYCAVCHGQAGAGNGPVGPKVGAPSILTPKAIALSDGHIYSLIRYGRGVMPRYGDKIYNPEQRWAIVNYVRTLQADAGAAVAAGGTQ
jgi:mono/diheme cytochrome c family protein